MAQKDQSHRAPDGSENTIIVKVYNPYGDLVGGKFDIVQDKVDKVSSLFTEGKRVMERLK